MQQPSRPLWLAAVAAAAIGIGVIVYSANAGVWSETAWPLARSGSRDQLLTFGLRVTPDPATNPVDPPERFEGYHTALDLEILPGEEEKDVAVSAVCDGEVIVADTAEGYGGVIVHRCTLDDEKVTVLYGHLDPASFAVAPGDTVRKGQHLASLGQANSMESGFTRKHLHLGIHKGDQPDFLGYVQTEAALEDFIDPESVLP